MTRCFTIAFLAAGLMTVGCGDSGSPNVMEGADAEAIQSYEEMVAADEAGMTDDEATDTVDDSGE